MIPLHIINKQAAAQRRAAGDHQRGMDSANWNRIRLSSKDDSYLRVSLKDGDRSWDWHNADPDGLLPTQHGRKS